jgi:hypothetical protein
MTKKSPARVPRPTEREIQAAWEPIRARVAKEEEAFKIANVGGHYRPLHEYVVFEALIKDLRAKMSKAELRQWGLAPILEIASAVLLGMKPPLPKPSSRHDYVYVVRVSREVTGLYAANGVEVRAPNVAEARRIVEDMDAQFKLQMKFEKAVNRQPLTVVFTDRRPAEDKQEATQGGKPL